MADIDLSAVLTFGANFGRSFTSAFSRADKRLDALRDSYGEQVRELRNVRTALRAATDPDDIRRLERRVDSLNDSLRQTRINMDMARESAERLGRVTGRIQTVGGIAAGAGLATAGAAIANQQIAQDRNRETRRAFARSSPTEQTERGFQDFQRDTAFFEGIGVRDAAEELGELQRESSLRVGEALRDQAGALFDANEKLGVDLEAFASATARERVRLVRDALRAANVSATEQQFLFEEFFGGSAAENILEPYLAAGAQITAAADERSRTVRTLTLAESDALQLAALRQGQLADASASLSNEVSLAMAPAFTRFNGILADSVNGLADWVSEQRGLTRASIIGVGALGALGGAAVSLAQPLGEAGFALSGLGQGLGALKGLGVVSLLGKMAGAFKAVTVASWGFTASLIANPIGAIITGVVVVIGLLVVLEAKFGLVSQGINRLSEIFVPAAKSIQDGLSGILELADGLLGFIAKIPGVNNLFDADGAREALARFRSDLEAFEVRPLNVDIRGAVSNALPFRGSQTTGEAIQQQVENGGPTQDAGAIQTPLETIGRQEVYHGPREVITTINQTNNFAPGATRDDAREIASQTADAVTESVASVSSAFRP